MKFIIKQEYEAAVPPLSDSEYQALEESIRFRGQLNPIVVNSQGVILDGHNRYNILTALAMEIKYITKDFEDSDQEYQYVVETNVNRRQLTAYSKIECYERLIQIFQLRAKANMLAASKGEKVPYAQGSTSTHFASTLGMGIRRLQDGLYIMKHGNEQMKIRLRKGTLTINAAKTVLDGKKPIIKYKKPKVRYQCNKCFHIHEKDELIIVKE